jgi:hypothetical protein
MRVRIQVINVLPRVAYLGKVNPTVSKRVGHIPGSVNVPIEEFVTDDDRQVFKPASELRSLLTEAGISPEKETVVHCQGGFARPWEYSSCPCSIGPCSCVRRIDGGVGEPRRHAASSGRGITSEPGPPRER